MGLGVDADTDDDGEKRKRLPMNNHRRIMTEMHSSFVFFVMPTALGGLTGAGGGT